MGRPSEFSAEVRQRAVRMVREHQDAYESQCAAITSIAEEFSCSPETLRKWTRRVEITDLERESRQLREANETLCKASRRVSPRRSSTARR